VCVIELGLGLLMVLGAAAIAGGLTSALTGGIDVLPLIGAGGVALLAASGLLLGAAGALRRAIGRHDGRRHGLRSVRLTAVSILIIGALAIGLPLATEALNLVRIDGFQLGYFLAAQLSLPALALVALIWAIRQNRIDAEETDR
jgi:putative solute:sodium symporter small subunit